MHPWRLRSTWNQSVGGQENTRPCTTMPMTWDHCDRKPRRGSSEDGRFSNAASWLFRDEIPQHHSTPEETIGAKPSDAAARLFKIIWVQASEDSERRGLCRSRGYSRVLPGLVSAQRGGARGNIRGKSGGSSIKSRYDIILFMHSSDNTCPLLNRAR